MLRLTLEIVPFGDEGLTRPIGLIHIGLRQVHGRNIGDYHIYCYDDTGELRDEFDVTDHPRDDGAWELVRRAVEAYLDKELR